MQKLVTLIFLFSFMLGISQENELKNKKSNIPTSIYSSTIVSPDLNSPFLINNRLNLKSFKFIVLNQNSIEENFFTIPICNLDRPPTKFIYDSYNRFYQNSILKQSFFKVSDLYRVRAKNPL